MKSRLKMYDRSFLNGTVFLTICNTKPITIFGINYPGRAIYSLPCAPIRRKR